MLRLCCYFLCLLGFCAFPSRAETIIRSVYQADFLGLPVSRSFITMTLNEKAYHIEGTGRTSPVTSIIAPMKATLDAKGAIDAGAVHPASFEAHVTVAKDTYDIKLELKNRTMVKESVVPQPSPKPDLVPVTEAMKKNVIDPLSAFLVPIEAPIEKACARTLPIYTGRERFDLALSFNRKEKVVIPGLFDGEAVVCSARYVPHGGHRSEKKEVKYMIGNKDMAAWFVPLPGVKLLGLYKVEIGTKLGRLTVTLEKAGLGPAPEKKP
jgi:hypothetical protein